MNPTKHSWRAALRFWRQQQGIAAVEFALALPVLLTLFYGVVEISRYILIAQKVEKLAHAVADMTTQSSVASTASFNQVMAATADVMSPYAVTTNSRIIISSLYRADGASGATVLWRYEGGGSLSMASRIGAVGAVPVMPGSFQFDSHENVIAAEVFYKFSPLISSRFFTTVTLYRVAFYKTRFGALLVPPV